MHTTHLREVDGSIMLAVPRALLDQLHLEAAATVCVHVDGGRLIVEPHQRPRYSLDELLAQCDASAPLTTADRLWIDAPSIGRELMNRERVCIAALDPAKGSGQLDARDVFPGHTM